MATPQQPPRYDPHQHAVDGATEPTASTQLLASPGSPPSHHNFDLANISTASTAATATPTPPAAANRKQEHPYRQPLLSVWAPEIGALFLSLAATVAAAVVLLLHDGRPVEEWGSPIVSLNTVISALGVLSRATLAFAVNRAIGQHKWNWFRQRQDGLGVFEKFDEASRGPWGSASLLWWSKAMNWASLGAFVTIIALLVDPFLQATVSLKGQTDVTRSASIIPVADYVDIGRMRMNGMAAVGIASIDGRAVDFSDPLPDFRINGAFFDGLSFSSSGIARGSATPRFECSTGNCTWPLYTTAAVCSRCNDLPPEDILKQPGTAQKVSEFYNATDYYTPDVMARGTYPFTNYSLAYGHIMHFNGDMTPNVFGLGEKPVLLTAFMNRDYTTSVSFQELDTTIATLLIFRAGEDYRHQNAKWEDSHPTATECGLYICAKAYQASATNGVLVETEIGSWAVRENRSWKTADRPEHSRKPADRILWESYDESSPGFADWYFLHTDLQVAIPGSALPQPTGAPIRRVFNITEGTIRGLQATMSSLFEVSSDAVQANLSPIRPTKVFLVYPNNNPSFANDVPDLLFRSANFSSTFNEVAARLTVQFRESSNATHAGVEGKYVLHIQVDWGFFALLVATLVAGCVYFVGVLVQTRRLKLPTWKESAYPVLGCGFGEETQARLRAADRAAYKSKAARRDRKKMQVALLDVEGGYRLVDVGGPLRAVP